MVEAKPVVWRAEPDVIIAGRSQGFQALGATSGHWDVVKGSFEPNAVAH